MFILDDDCLPGWCEDHWPDQVSQGVQDQTQRKT